MSALASVTALDEARQRGLPFANASEWTLTASEKHHRLIERTTTIMRKRGSHWSWRVAATFRLHVRENPACPLCKQMLRRERIRDHRLYGSPSGRPS